MAAASDSAPPPGGVPQRFTDLYREHHAAVSRWVRTLGVPEGENDDVVQEVFLVVHRRLEAYDERGSVRSWLFQIARRVCRDYRRGRNRAKSREDRVEGPVAGPSVDDEVARREAVLLMQSLLNQLDENKRLVFVLTEVDGMAAADVAEALEIPVSRVHSRLRQARASFERMVARLRAREHRRKPNE